MPKPRKAQVSLEATPYYHCVSRCVRRAFLCGEDKTTGTDYEHRRAWIRDRMLALAKLFAIDVCAYAVMSNHYHVVLHVDHETAQQWSVDEVIARWHGLFKGAVLTQRYLRNELTTRAELDAVHQLAECWRERLMDISWFMRCLNEPIARQANQEDRCTGRFWEGRYKSQALLDEKALAACLVYVDLNPVRAGIAKTPEDSDLTSVQDRARQARSVLHPNQYRQQALNLHPFAGNPRQDMPKGLPFRLTDYLELVDLTGRVIREGKRGAIPANLPSILDRLQIDPKHWLYMTQHFESRFKGLVGTAYNLKSACQKLGYQRTPNLGACRQLL